MESKLMKKSKTKTLFADSLSWISWGLRAERGDVPGWVLITLMTAGLVVLMWTAAGPALKGVFDQAMNKVVAF
jgi:hypothetical protein